MSTDKQTDPGAAYLDKISSSDPGNDIIREYGDVLRQACNYIASHKEYFGHTILELNCATGLMTGFLAGTFPGSKIVAIDENESALKAAEKRIADSGIGNVEFRNCSAGDVDGLFDTVFSMGTLPENMDEHLLPYAGEPLLYQFAAAHGIAETGDKIFPAVATSGLLPAVVGVFFVLGLVSSAYGAGGSALTSLTTSFTVDILKKEGDVRVRKLVHVVMAVLMVVTILIFNALNSTSAIDAVYKLASYTYGPILGLFAFGILTKKRVKDRYVPIVALLAPAVCLVLQLNSERWFGGYRFSYELLPVNAALTFLGLLGLAFREK